MLNARILYRNFTFSHSCRKGGRVICWASERYRLMMAMEEGASTHHSTYAFTIDLDMHATCRCDLRQRRDAV